MNINKLNREEFAKLFLPVIRLADTKEIKGNFYSLLRFTKYSANEPFKSAICPKTTNYLTTYNGYEIKVTNIYEPGSEKLENMTVCHFRRKRKLIDLFGTNPNMKLKKEIIKIFEREFHSLNLVDLFNGGKRSYSMGNKIENIFYPNNCLNDNWKNDGFLSCLLLYLKEDISDFVLEFSFFPEAFVRINNQTKVKDNWTRVINAQNY